MPPNLAGNLAGARLNNNNNNNGRISEKCPDCRFAAAEIL